MMAGNVHSYIDVEILIKNISKIVVSFDYNFKYVNIYIIINYARKKWSSVLRKILVHL